MKFYLRTFKDKNTSLVITPNYKMVSEAILLSNLSSVCLSRSPAYECYSVNTCINPDKVSRHPNTQSHQIIYPAPNCNSWQCYAAILRSRDTNVTNWSRLTSVIRFNWFPNETLEIINSVFRQIFELNVLIIGIVSVIAATDIVITIIILA